MDATVQYFEGRPHWRTMDEGGTRRWVHLTTPGLSRNADSDLQLQWLLPGEPALRQSVAGTVLARPFTSLR